MKNIPTVTQANRHLIAVYTFFVLLPLVYYIPAWLQENSVSNRLLVTIMSLAIIVPIVSYIALPLLFKIMAYLNNN